jgi:hypothetical protein
LSFSTELIVLFISFYFIFSSIFNANEVGFDTLFASISGYILLGIILGITSFLYQSSFAGSYEGNIDPSRYNAYYYAFTTMSTLGYGDIVPKSSGAKGLSILITLIGQFYMVIVMGIIIGKLLSKPHHN